MNKEPAVIYGHVRANQLGSRLLSDKCNDSQHRSCRSSQCECLCHERQPRSPKPNADKQPTLSEVYGDIEIKPEPIR